MMYVIEKNGKYFAGEIESEGCGGYETETVWVEKESPKVLTFARKDYAKGLAKSLSAKLRKFIC